MLLSIFLHLRFRADLDRHWKLISWKLLQKPFKRLYLPQSHTFHAQTLKRNAFFLRVSSRSFLYSFFFFSLAMSLFPVEWKLWTVCSSLITGSPAVFPPAQQRGDVLLGAKGTAHETGCGSEFCSLSPVEAVQKLGRGTIKPGYSGSDLVLYTAFMLVTSMIKCLCFSIYVHYVN